MQRPLSALHTTTIMQPLSQLRVGLILGSTRTQGPPLHLGARVGLWLRRVLEQRGHVVDTVDPVLEALPLLRQPHFTYAPGKAPGNLDALAERLAAADCYVMCTPEYNHAPSPALLNILNHFGSSIFSYKPSAIASYSAGQWGGTRAAHALRPTLSELGCLPVSAMVHVPKAGEVFMADGTPKPAQDAERWEQYAGRTFAQLEWWAMAAHHQRTTQGDPTTTLRSTPAQRDAP